MSRGTVSIARLYFDVHGLRISYTTSSQTLAKETLKDLHRYAYLESDARQYDASLTLTLARYVSRLHPPPNSIRDALGAELQVFTKGSRRLVSLDSNGSITIDLIRDRVEAILSKALQKSFIPRALLKWSIIKGQEKRNLFSVHSSSVLRDGKTLLFVGRSGAGKTSTLLNFLTHGYVMLSDDITFFGSGTMYPFSMRSDLRVDTIQRLRAGINSAQGTHLKHLRPGLIDLTTIFEGKNEHTPISDLSIFYLNVWNSQRTKVSKVSPNKMLGLLVESYLAELSNSYWFGWDKTRTISRIINAYGELVEDRACYSVYAGSKLEHLYRAIEGAV